MSINILSSQSIFRSQMQNPMQSTIGQLQKMFQQANANYIGNKNCSNRNYDTVELSKKALEMLDEQAEPDQMAIFGYQKYPPGISKEEWAERSILEQRNGIKTYSDLVDYAKSKLQFTISKIEELENYLNGTGTHSNPNMTKGLAKLYLNNYKQSTSLDYTEILSMQYGRHQSLVDEFDKLSGGLASEVTENLLNSISAESLGLSNLSGDPREIMRALENASNILNGMNQRLESAYIEMTGRKFTEPARSSALFFDDGSMDFLAFQVEKAFTNVDTKVELDFTGKTLIFVDNDQMKFTGQTLDLLDTDQMKFID